MVKKNETVKGEEENMIGYFSRFCKVCKAGAEFVSISRKTYCQYLKRLVER